MFGIGIIGSDDLVFLSPTANANRSPVKRAPGQLRFDLDGDPDLVAVLRRISEPAEQDSRLWSHYEWKSPYRSRMVD